MCTRAKQTGFAVAVLALVAGFCVAAGTVAAQDQDVLSDFKMGVKYYQAGEIEQAESAFASVLAADPGLDTATAMRDAAPIGTFIDMKDNAQLADEAEALQDLMSRAVREKKRTVENADQLVSDLKADDTQVYNSARIALVGHGPYAVPYVLPLLADSGPKGSPANTAAARAAGLLAEMHPDACLPLIVVLHNSEQDLLKRRVAVALGKIGDSRAVPALLAIARSEKELAPTREAAAAALDAIKDGSGGTVGPAYVALAMDYYNENKDRVGYRYGLSASVWQWNDAGDALPEKVVYEQVPNYLYYQRMASETALAGLDVRPGNHELLAILAASQARQLALCTFYMAEDTLVGGEPVAEEVRKDAAERAAKFETDVPVLLRLMPASVVSRAEELALQAESGASSLFLIQTLGKKLDAERPSEPDQESVNALVAALSSGNKDVRYSAAVGLVKTRPTGEDVPAEQAMSVLKAALQSAATRNALVLIDEMQIRNKLVSVLREAGVATSETRVHRGMVELVLGLEPSVDIVFVSANVDPMLFDITMELLKTDPRTKDAALYVLADPTEAGADLGKWENIDQVLSTDHIRASVIEPILQEKVFAKSRSAFTEEDEAIVLKAAQAVLKVDPADTRYDLSVLEPALIKALTGYSEEVSMAAVEALALIGAQQSVDPLAQLVAGDGSVELKMAACRGIAAILRRAEAAPSEDAMAILKNALAGDVQELREAAAEALSVANLNPRERLALIVAEGMKEE